jgi:hypothetical protein
MLIIHNHILPDSWSIVDQWLLKYPQCTKTLMTVVETGSLDSIEKRNIIDPITGAVIGKRIKAASEYFLKAFVNFFGHFPLASGPATLSSLRFEV